MVQSEDDEIKKTYVESLASLSMSFGTLNNSFLS